MFAMLALRIIYALNILVAGFVGLSSLFFPRHSSVHVFQNTITPNWAQRIVGCFWTAIATVSVLGLRHPLRFSPVLLIQLLYKGTWLLVIALPMIAEGRLHELPTGMTVFFAVWVIALLLVLPYDYLLDIKHSPKLAD